MKQNNISTLPRLRDENFENIFNVYEDPETSAYYYNLIQTISFPQNLPDGYFTPYTITYGDTWPYIAYKIYKNPNVWWILILANNIQNPTKLPENGTIIKAPKPTVLRTVLAQLKTEDN
jgi:nucleoid-associated protein YgaU